MKILNYDQIVRLHEDVIRRTGGEPGVRDGGLLTSAILSPFQVVCGVDVYPTIEEKAARLCFGIIKNHPFFDGNKRAGAHAMLVFLEVNNIKLNYTQSEFSEFIWAVAAGEIGVNGLIAWLLKHICQ